MNELYVASVMVIAALSVVAVLTSRFDDNLTQRMGLFVICLGSAGVLFTSWRDGFAAENSRVVMTFGVALFGAGSALKAWKYRGRAPKHLRGHNDGKANS